MTSQRFWREFAVNFLKKTEHLFFWTKKVARKCKMSKCSSSGQKKNRVHLLFWSRFFFMNLRLPWCKCDRSFRSTPTWRNVVTGYPVTMPILQSLEQTNTRSDPSTGFLVRINGVLSALRILRIPINMCTRVYVHIYRYTRYYSC